MPAISSLGRKLIPLSEYTKPLLQLGKHDRGQVWQLKKMIFQKEKRLVDLQNELGLPGLSGFDKLKIKQEIEKLLSSISDSQGLIREIKHNAYINQIGQI